MSDRVKPEGYNTPVPAKILTPDRVETRIGTLEFADGFPTEATARAALRPPRLPAGCRGVPQRRAGGVAGGDAHRDGGGRRHGLPPGRHPRPPAGLGPAVPDRQHRHRLRVGHPRPRARRPHRRRDPARLRPDHRQRRLVPVHHRHGPAGSGSRRGRQVPDRARRLRRADPRRVLRVGVAVADQLADPARPARRRQARRADPELPRGPARLPALPGGRSAGDGVHLAVREGVQHHPRQRRLVLRRARRGDPA